MGKRGDQARKNLTKTLEDFFIEKGQYVTTKDKKLYVNIPDGAFGAEEIQFAIAFTMPKDPVVEATPNNSSSIDSSAKPVQISAEDQAKVQELLARLEIET